MDDEEELSEDELELEELNELLDDEPELELDIDELELEELSELEELEDIEDEDELEEWLELLEEDWLELELLRSFRVMYPPSSLNEEFNSQVAEAGKPSKDLGWMYSAPPEPERVAE